MESGGLLILGAGGLLGSELAALRKEALRPSHEELDLTERGALYTAGLLRTAVENSA